PKGFLLRDIKADRYPYRDDYPDFSKRRRWEEHDAVEVTATACCLSAGNGMRIWIGRRSSGTIQRWWTLRRAFITWTHRMRRDSKRQANAPNTIGGIFRRG